MNKGNEQLASVFTSGKVLSVMPHEMNGTNGTITWYSGNLLLSNGQIFQNITLATGIEPASLELMTKDYSFGIQVVQEIAKNGFNKFSLKVVYVTDDDVEYL